MVVIPIRVWQYNDNRLSRWQLSLCERRAQTPIQKRIKSHLTRVAFLFLARSGFFGGKGVI